MKKRPKSQSDVAREKKSDALDRAGTAILEGDPTRAEQILDDQARRETEPPSPEQAVEVLSEARTIENQLTAIELKIDSVKEHYKELKAQRDKLVIRLRSEVRDMGQGRLPFEASGDHVELDPEPIDPFEQDSPAKRSDTIDVEDF